MEKEDTKHKPKYFLNFCAHFLWIVFFIVIFILVSIGVNYHKVPLIYGVQQNQIWNSSYDPHVLGYISDAHISKYFPHSITDTKIILDILNESGVEKILVTGDICDNFGSRSMIKHGHQFKKDFNTYINIIKDYPDDFIIVASGNHDEFGIDVYNSSKHYILHYVDIYKENKLYKEYDNFLISKVKHDDIDIFVMNAYHYPTVNAGLGYYMNIKSGMINRIESVLSEPTNANARILITHFPLSYTTERVRSKSKKTLMQVMTTSNMTVLLAGHTHRELIVHRNTTLELHPWAIKRGLKVSQAYRYITVDNGNFNDHAFNLKVDRPSAIVTYPITKKIISHRTDFSFKTFNQADVRVVYFSENPNLSISVTCSCKSIKYKSNSTLLKFQRVIRRNQSLYSTPLKQLCDPYDKINQTNSTEFILTFSGDYNYETVFVTGNFVQLNREKLDTDVSSRKALLVVGVICWILILITWCPFPPLNSFSYYCNWVWGKNLEYTKSSKTTAIECISIIFGFTYMKSQIYLGISKWIQIVYFVFVFTPLFVPFCIIKVGKYYGFIGFFGYYLGSFALDHWPLTLSCFFALIVLLPSTIIFAEIAFMIQTKKWNYYLIVYFLLEALHIVLIVVMVSATLYQSTTTALSILSPIFVFIPIVILIMQALSLKRIREKENEKETDDSDNNEYNENHDHEKDIINQGIKL